MLLEIAISDAYGVGFEFANSNLRFNDGHRYVKHPRHPIAPGCYSDDTQMSIAIAEAMLRNDFSPLGLANKFVECFKRDPRTGYSYKFYEFLKSISSGEEFLKKINPDSEKSGAAMRSVPLGLIASIDELLHKTEAQAKLTHNTPNGIQAAQAVALISHYFIYNINKKDELPRWLSTYLGDHWTQPFSKNKVGIYGIDAVKAALTAIMSYEFLSEILISSISFTGDVDTVAAIAVGCASQSDEILNDLSENLYLLLENQTYGRDFLITLDQQLASQFLKRK